MVNAPQWGTCPTCRFPATLSGFSGLCGGCVRDFARWSVELFEHFDRIPDGLEIVARLRGAA